MRHGFILIRKPKGPTSHDAVGTLRRTLHEKSIGHLGTLDPMAEGLMVMAVGAKALKVVELFMGLPKTYVAEITLGATSTTYDGEGVITTQEPKAGWTPPDDQSTIQALINDRFVGSIKQVPPIFSAVHIGGERAYRKAQRGENVEMKAREVTISECTVLEYAFPRLTVRVSCDSGTYIRSLANDLGESMRCGGYLSSLLRTKVGDWSLDNAVVADAAAFTDVMPLKDVLAHLPKRELTDAEFKEIGFGRMIDGTCTEEGLIAWHGDLPVAILERSRRDAGKLKPRKVL